MLSSKLIFSLYFEIASLTWSDFRITTDLSNLQSLLPKHLSISSLDFFQNLSRSLLLKLVPRSCSKMDYSSSNVWRPLFRPGFLIIPLISKVRYNLEDFDSSCVDSSCEVFCVDPRDDRTISKLTKKYKILSRSKIHYMSFKGIGEIW